MELNAGENDHNRRLDRILRKALPEVPLSGIARLIRRGGVRVNGARVEGSHRVQSGDLIDLRESLAAAPEKAFPCLPSQGLKEDALDIIYEDQGLLVLNKAADSEVQTELCALVRAYLLPKLPPSLSFTPGPLHRLDRGTSGLVAFGKSLEGAREFSRLLQERRIKKTYLALVRGSISAAATWQDKLAGKEALSHIRPLTHFYYLGQPLTLLEVRLETGRKHQIRAQAELHGCPLIGDAAYGGAFGGLTHYYLHAWRMDFPDGRRLEAPYPKGWEKMQKF